MSDRVTGAAPGNCSGCGATLQTNEPGAVGYIPNQALSREPVVCQRCFRIKHYNEVSGETVHPDDFFKILGRIGQERALVVHIADIFDFEGSIIQGLHRFIGENPVILALNKFDLLPKSTNPNRIIHWAQKQAKDNGLKVGDIVLCSARKNYGFERLTELLANRRKGTNIYVVGATNVGKSSLINRLIREYSDLGTELTVSRYPGTTLDVVRIPLEDGSHVIDTPGIVYTYRMTEIIPKRDLGILLPDKEIKPIVFQLNEQQSLFFGGLARFDFVQGEPQSFACFVSNALNIHRTKLERADELFSERRGDLFVPPSRDDLGAMPVMTRHQFRIPKESRVDAVISGLGWIKMGSDSGCVVDIHAPRGVKVVLRPSLI